MSEFGAQKLDCFFEKSCFLSLIETGPSGCEAASLSAQIQSTEGSKVVRFTPPNGKTIQGLGAIYSRHGTLEYSALAFSSGSGGTHVTIFPDGTALWTGHFTLNGNVALTHFGRCEGAN